jgi:sigma-B regulation protein RsbU (phosphoserine phosphatase)
MIKRDYAETNDASGSAAERSPTLRGHESTVWATDSRIKADLAAAARIQRSLLPARPSLPKGVRLAWELEPCHELAGDILNVFQLDGGQLGLYLLDVSGHGVPAAMLSFSVHKFVTQLASLPLPYTDRARMGDGGAMSPAEVCHRLNQLYPMDPEIAQYFTMLYGILDPETRVFRFSSAGQCPPIYLPPGDTPFEMEANGIPIGLFADASYEECSIELVPGGRLYIYSDGLTEAWNEDCEMFGVKRLLRAIEEGGRLSVQGSASRILEHVHSWSHPGRPQDDVSLLIVEAD